MERSPGADDVADPVLESVGCGEEEVAVEPDNSDARRLLVVGIVGDVPVDLCARLTPSRAILGRVVTAISHNSESAMPIARSGCGP